MITIDNYKEYLLKLKLGGLKILLFIILIILNENKNDNKTDVIRSFFEYYDQYTELNEFVNIIERNLISKCDIRQKNKIVKAITKIYDYEILENNDDDIVDYYKNNVILFYNYIKELIKEEINKIEDSKILLSLLFHILYNYVYSDVTRYFIEYNSITTEESKIKYVRNLISVLLSDEEDLLDFGDILLKFVKNNYVYGNVVPYLLNLKIILTLMINNNESYDSITTILFYILYKNKPADYVSEFSNLLNNNDVSIFDMTKKTIDSLTEEQLLDFSIKYNSYTSGSKDIYEVFGEYNGIIINEIVQEVSSITEKEFLLGIIFKLLQKKLSLTIIEDFDKIRREQTEIGGLIGIITNDYLADIKTADLITILGEIRRVKEEFSKISFNSRGSVCDKKQKIINKYLINYKLEIKTINEFQAFYVIVNKIKNEFILQSLIYYIFKNYLFKNHIDKVYYIKEFLINMKNYYNKQTTLEHIILKEVNYKLNRIQLLDILEKLDNPRFNIERNLLNIHDDLKKHYFYTDLLILKTDNDGLIRALIKVLYFDYIQVINPKFNEYDIKSQLKFICDLYQAILSNDELVLNHSFKERLKSVVEIIIFILENPRDNTKNNLIELKKKKGIPLIYMFYNLINGITQKETVVRLILSFLKNESFINRLNPEHLHLQTEEKLELLREANILDDIVFRNISSTMIYQMLIQKDDIMELKKLIMMIVYNKYIKKEINNEAIINLIKKINLDLNDSIGSLSNYNTVSISLASNSP